MSQGTGAKRKDNTTKAREQPKALQARTAASGAPTNNGTATAGEERNQYQYQYQYQNKEGQERRATIALLAPSQDVISAPPIGDDPTLGGVIESTIGEGGITNQSLVIHEEVE